MPKVRSKRNTRVRRNSRRNSRRRLSRKFMKGGSSSYIPIYCEKCGKEITKYQRENRQARVNPNTGGKLHKKCYFP